jgi:hypothetical protein
MYERVERPLTKTERRHLERELKRLSRPSPMIGSGYFGCSGIVFGVLWLLTLLAEGRAALLPASVLWGVLFVGLPIVLDAGDAISRPKRIRELRSHITGLIERNLAREERVEASAMVAFEELEDHGLWYAYQVEPEVVYFLSIGQEYPWDRRVRCSAFSIVELGRSWAYVSKRGRPLEPARVISAEEQARMGLGPGARLPVGTFPGRLDNLEEILTAQRTDMRVNATACRRRPTTCKSLRGAL